MSEDSQVDPLLTPEQEVSSDGPQDSTSTHLNEDLALSKLKDRDLAAAKIEEISKNSGVMKSRKVRLAIASHPHTTRRIALKIIRELYTFDLMQFALTPTAAADLKRLAEELLVPGPRRRLLSRRGRLPKPHSLRPNTISFGS